MFRLKSILCKLVSVSDRKLGCRYISSIQTKSVSELLESSLSSGELVEQKTEIRVTGWVKSFRDQKKLKFIHLKDGRDAERHLQLVYLGEGSLKSGRTADEVNDLFKSVSFNAALEATGVLVKSSHAKQSVELHLTDLKVLGACNPDSYPFKVKANYTLEQIRPHVHLRSHTQPFVNILQFRSHLTMSCHEFFMKNHFIQVHTPIITTNNCEGGCETFQVTINDKDLSLSKSLSELSRSAPAGDSTSGDKTKLENLNSSDPEKRKHFFSRPVYLTASAQLHLETMTSQLGNVYTLSPTFRAEKSLTRHHLAEFYMLEAELVDMTHISPMLDFVERFVKEVSLAAYEKTTPAHLQLISSMSVANKSNNYTQTVIKSLSSGKFERLTYAQALEILNRPKYAKKMRRKIEFGDDLSKEHEQLLVESFDHVPVFVTNYPKSIKPFYMRQSGDNEELVDNFDLLVPYVGELIGGSLREHRLDVLERRIREQGLDVSLLEQYLATKKYGAHRMGGFGLGLERFIQFLCNVDNIKDVCAFPRSLFSCKM